MAKITKKQEQQFSALTLLFHELIAAKHQNKRDIYEYIIERIHNVTAPEEE